MEKSRSVSVFIMKNCLRSFLIFLVFFGGIYGRKLNVRDYEEVEYTNNQESDYSNNQEDDYDNGDGDDITCSSAANMSSQFNQYELDDKILTILKLGPVIDLSQITMFEELQTLFRSKNFKKLQFMLVTPNNLSDYYANNSEFQLLADGLSEFTELLHLNESDFNDFGFEFLLDDNNVYLIDNCQRLNFIIVYPWSMIVYPYVKAAVLSTIYDVPCGTCKKWGTEVEQTTLENDIQYVPITLDSQLPYIPEATLKTNTESNEEFSEQSSTTDLGGTTPDPRENEIDVGDEDIEDIRNMLDLYKFENDKNSSNEDYVIPLRIILPAAHIHYDKENNSHELHEYIVLKTDDVDYHEHIANHPKTNLHEYKPDAAEANVNLNIGKKTISEVVEKVRGPVFINKERTLIYKILKSYNVTESMAFDEVESIDFDIEKMTDTQIERDVRSHYELLKKWLSYKF